MALVRQEGVIRHIGLEIGLAQSREPSIYPVSTTFVRTLQPVKGGLGLQVAKGCEMGVIPSLDQLAVRARNLVKGEPHVALVSSIELNGASPLVYEQRVLALARRMGTIMPADDKGTQLVRIYDTGDRRSLADGGLYRHSRTPGKPHTDNICLPNDIDCLMLACMRPATNGGESVLVSAKKVREIILQENPRAAAVLANPNWLFSTKGMGKEEVFTKPILTEDGRAHYMGDYLERAHERAGKPLTREQKDALTALEKVLEREELKTVIPLNAGDILLTEDSRWFHSRESWLDDPSLSTGETRSLVRVWVRWPQPDERSNMERFLTSNSS